MSPDRILIEKTFHAPAERVWEAISSNEKMKDWYFDISEFEPEPGFEFRFIAGDDKKQYMHLCKVKEVRNGRKLSYSWKYEGYPGETLVTFEVFPEDEQTVLRLTHEGLESFEPAKYPELAKENFVQGWEQIIGENLKKYVENQ